MYMHVYNNMSKSNYRYYLKKVLYTNVIHVFVLNFMQCFLAVVSLSLQFQWSLEWRRLTAQHQPQSLQRSNQRMVS